MRSMVLLCCCVLPAFGLRAQGILFSGNELDEFARQEFARYVLQTDSLRPAGAYTRLQEVNRRLVGAVARYYSARERQRINGYVWGVALVPENHIQAFYLPGGRLVMDTGMFRWTQKDDALAVVISHQLAHMLLAHGEKRLQGALQEKTGGKRLAELKTSRPADARDFFLTAFGAGNIALLDPFSNEQEQEADKLSMMLTALAGYDPRENIVFWKRMAYVSDGPTRPILMSAHRYDPARIAAMEEAVEAISRKYYHPPTGKKP